ncbi:MAG: oligosaccharide flippase family protein [Candidatus Aenigmatarchaeota archaeon]
MIEAIKLKINALKNGYLPAGSLRARFVKGAFWSFVGAVISRGLNLISSIIVARLLGTVGYGELGIIQSTVGMFGVFAGLGLGMTATKYVAEFREKDPQKAGRIIALSSLMAFISGGIVSIILVILSPWLASSTLSAPHLSGLLQLSAGLLFFGAINGAQTGALAGFEAFKTIAIVNFLSGIISFPLMVAGVWFFQLKGAVLALVASMIVNYFLNKIAIRIECQKFNIKPNFSSCFAEIPVLWKFSIPAFLSSAMVGPVTWLCNTMLVNQPNGYAEMGIFNAANQVRNAIIFLPSSSFYALFPIMSSELNKKNPSNEQRLHVINAYSTWYVATGLTAVVIFFTRQILNLFGKEFIAGEVTLIIVLFSIPILTYKDGIARLVQVKELMWYSLFSNMLWGVFLIVLTLKLVKYGSVGLSIGYLISYFLNTLIVVPFYFRKIKMLRLIKNDLLIGVGLTLALLPALLSKVFNFNIFIFVFFLSISLYLFIRMGVIIYSWLKT